MLVNPRVVAFAQLVVHSAVHSREFLLSCFKFSSQELIPVIG